MSKPRVGCHLIMWRAQGEEALARAFDEIAAIGYTGVEAGMALPTERLKEMLAERGLEYASSHTNVERLEENLEAELAHVKALGADVLSVSGGRPGEGRDPAAYFRRNGEILERCGRRAAEAGVKLCYHNHAHEIENDLFGLGHVLEPTSPEHVHLCLDLYWVRKGGQDPLEVLKRYRDRTPYVHMKDYKDGEFAEIGQGSLDWPAIAREIESMQLSWVMVEQDRTTRTPKESATLSYNYIHNTLGW